MKKNLLRNIFLFVSLCHFASAEDDCTNSNTGSWFNLKTVTSLQITGDCKFNFRGPNCESSGQINNPLEEQGEIFFKTSSISPNASCPFHGEKSCKYVQLEQELLVSCNEKENESYAKEKLHLNIKRLSEDAKDGDNKAQKKLAIHYLTTNQAKKAFPILKQMARKKDADAISALGLVNYYGTNGFRKNSAESLKWNRIASANGSAEANYILGNHYSNGQGVKKSYADARKWYQKAAVENNIPAQKELAQMWNEGVEGVVEKYDAQYWLNQAIGLGDKEAISLLAHLDDEPIRAIASEEKPTKQPEPIKTKEELKPAVAETKPIAIVPALAPAPAPAPAPPPPAQEPIATIQEIVTVDRGYRYFDSIFLVKPYFLFQERQGAVPSVALGITPGVQMGQMSLKMQASVSLLNMALGDTFAAFDVATVLGFKIDTLFFELGYGFEFWPSPGGTAQEVSISAGKILTKDLFGVFPVKTVSIGFSQTFFEDRTYKIFIGTSF